MHSVISIYISVADASIHVSVYLRRSYVMRESVDELKTKKESAIELSTRRQSYTNTSIHSHTHTCAMYEWSVCMNERVGAPPDIPFPTRMLDWDRCTNYVECEFTYQAKANMFYFIIIAIHRAVSVGCRRLYTNTHTHTQPTNCHRCLLLLFAETSILRRRSRIVQILFMVPYLISTIGRCRLRSNFTAMPFKVRCMGFGFMFRVASPRQKRRNWKKINRRYIKIINCNRKKKIVWEKNEFIVQTHRATLFYYYFFFACNCIQ